MDKVKVYSVGILTTIMRLTFYSLLVGGIVYLYEATIVGELTEFPHHMEESFKVGVTLEAWLSFWRAIISEAAEDVTEGITVETIIRRVLQ